MLWNDLREYLDKLDELGMLTKIQGADWDEEIGAISELMIERGGPALVFDNIPGYPEGFRVTANIAQKPQFEALALGLDHEQPLARIAEEWERVIGACELVPPHEVPDGPVFENVLTGDDIDLFKFPTPKWHDKDQGRYIGTGSCVIQRDPDSGWVNVGCYRVVVHDKNTCGIFMNSNNHGAQIREMYWKRGEKCPVVVSVGQEPILQLMSGGGVYHAGYGQSEFDVAGYLHKEPYPVIKGPVTGLPIPATAEIVIEGFIPSPQERMEPEGPFGEWTGYYGHGRRPETVIEVAAIYHRDDPIISGEPPVRHIRAYKQLRGTDGRTKARLEKSGIQGIRGVSVVARPGFYAVSLKQMYEGHVEDVMRVLEPGGDARTGNRTWVLVDEDIDPANTPEVLWAIATRLIPEHGVTVIPGTSMDQLDPRIPPGMESDPSAEGRRKYSAHNLVINACRPYAWIDQFPKVNINSRELRESVEAKWSWLFEGLPPVGSDRTYAN